MSVRYSTLSEQLWSKSTLGATLDRAPPARAPAPTGPPEPPVPAIPGPRQIGHPVRGTRSHRPGPPGGTTFPGVHRDDGAALPVGATLWSVGVSDKPKAHRGPAGGRSTRYPRLWETVPEVVGTRSPAPSDCTSPTPALPHAVRREAAVPPGMPCLRGARP